LPPAQAGSVAIAEEAADGAGIRIMDIITDAVRQIAG